MEKAYYMNNSTDRKGLATFTQLVKVWKVTSFWHFRASDFHETFTRSFLAQIVENFSPTHNLPFMARSGQKNGHSLMEFWPLFDISQRLRPYICSKRRVLGFYRQAVHRRPSNEPFFLTLGTTSPPSILGMAQNAVWRRGFGAED